MAVMDRPVIVITFQGVLGDFIKDGGLSAKQDHLMSRQYLAQQANNSTDYHMWVRLGALDGLRYL